MSTCAMRQNVDDHFALAIDAARERAMRAHLAGCDGCRAHYRRRALLASLDPGAPKAKERMAKALGLREEEEKPAPVLPGGTTSPRPLRFVPIAAALLAAAVILLVLRPPRDDGFHARGSGQLAVSRVSVYRVHDGGVTRASGAIARDDELAFAYENPDKKPFLMIFAKDDRGRVYWFYPAWTNESESPRAIAADSAPGRHELREAVRHRFDGERVEIHAVFLDEAVTVRQMEAEIAKGGRLGPVSESQTFTFAP